MAFGPDDGRTVATGVLEFYEDAIPDPRREVRVQQSVLADVQITSQYSAIRIGHRTVRGIILRHQTVRTALCLCSRSVSDVGVDVIVVHDVVRLGAPLTIMVLSAAARRRRR